MELSLALQESQRLLTAWQTPLLFVVVQLLVVLIFFKKSSSSTESAGEDEEPDFWSSIYRPSQISRLSSFRSLPRAVVPGLRNWARRAASHASADVDHQEN